jgi:hypothetical protein
MSFVKKGCKSKVFEIESDSQFWITSHFISSAGFGYFVMMSCIEVCVGHNVIMTEVWHSRPHQLLRSKKGSTITKEERCDASIFAWSSNVLSLVGEKIWSYGHFMPLRRCPSYKFSRWAHISLDLLCAHLQWGKPCFQHVVGWWSCMSSPLRWAEVWRCALWKWLQ